MADIEWSGCSMGVNALGCCYVDLETYTKVSRSSPGAPGEYTHVEKLKNLVNVGQCRKYERMDKAIWKLCNNDYDSILKFSLHLDHPDPQLQDKEIASYTTTLTHLVKV